jgi:hypothetical protein
MSKSRDSPVGIAMGYGLDGQGVRLPGGVSFSLLRNVHACSRAMGTGDSFPRGYEAGA